MLVLMLLLLLVVVLLPLLLLKVLSALVIRFQKLHIFDGDAFG